MANTTNAEKANLSQLEHRIPLHQSISYWDMIKGLAPFYDQLSDLPRLKFRFQTPSPVKARMIQINLDAPNQVFRFSTDSEKDRAHFWRWYTGLEYQDIETKLFIVEDLCFATIDLIGEIFRFPDPELLGIHLKDAGTHSKPYGHRPPRGRTSSPFKQSHTSIRWYRSGTIRTSMLAKLQDHHSMERLMDGHSVTFGREDDKPQLSDDFVPPSFVPSRLTQDRHSTSLKIGCNIFRHHVVLATNPANNRDAEVFCMWEERATVLTTKEAQSTSNVLVILDPLPLLEIITNSDEGSLIKRCLPYDPIRKQRHTNSDQMELLLNPTSRQTTQERLEWAKQLIKLRSSTIPTGEDLYHSLSAQYEDNTLSTTFRVDKLHGPIGGLLTIIATDLYDTFDVMSQTLNQISRESLDETQLQERVNHWRSLTTRIREEVPQLVEEFTTFALDQEHPVHLDRVEKLVHSVSKRGNKVLEQLTQTANDIRADMSLLESRRGIQEAESVTRLTELAFIFAPLTFVSGIFSMQIREIQDGVPYTTVIITATIAVALLYSARMFANSATFGNTKQSLHRRSQRLQNIVVSTGLALIRLLHKLASTLVWGEGRVWKFYVLITAIAIAVAPVAFFWTRTTLDLGLKVVISLICIPSGCALIYLTLTSFTEGSRWDIFSVLTHGVDETGSDADDGEA